jgi:uncharacterized metal-binding protein
MNDIRRKVAIVPCSGIGKPYGTVSREAGYDLCEDLRPDTTELVALSRLVMGDETARQTVAKFPAIAIDGCKLMCAAKMVRQSGGTVAQEVAVLDVYRHHKDLKPEGIAELNDAGLQLARVLAEEVTEKIDELAPPDTRRGEGGSHG